MKRKAKVNKSATLVAEGTQFVGNIEFDNQLIVNGRIEGNVDADPESEAMLVVGLMGHIVGRISVPHVVTDGLIEGEVRSSIRVDLSENARLIGDVHYRSIEVQLGAKLEGRLIQMVDADERNVRHIRSQKEIS